MLSRLQRPTWCGRALAQVLAEIPAGAWTTYSDVAAVIGTHQVPLGQRLANHPAPNAHRVLKSGGIIAPNFRWLEPAARTIHARSWRPKESRSTTRAERTQRSALRPRISLSSRARHRRLRGDRTVTERRPVTERARFVSQLDELQSPDVVNGLAGTARSVDPPWR